MKTQAAAAAAARSQLFAKHDIFIREQNWNKHSQASLFMMRIWKITPVALIHSSCRFCVENYLRFQDCTPTTNRICDPTWQWSRWAGRHIDFMATGEIRDCLDFLCKARHRNPIYIPKTSWWAGGHFTCKQPAVMLICSVSHFKEGGTQRICWSFSQQLFGPSESV